MKKLTQEYLKYCMNYDYDTGLFKWIFSSNQIQKGNIAGSLDDGYIRIGFRGKQYRAHRLAWFYMFGVWPEQIDHINGIRSDNRIINLRDVNNSENQRNRKIGKSNTSGCIGVTFEKEKKLWRARINVNGKRVGLGRFKNKLDAIIARKRAEKEFNYHENHGRK